MAKLEQRIEKLEARKPNAVECDNVLPIYFNDLRERMKLRKDREKAIDADPDPMVRYEYWLALCVKNELALNAVFIPRPGFTVNLGPQLAAISKARQQYRLRAAELELLHAAGYDTTELQAQHNRATSYNWRHQPLPTAAQSILDRTTTERKQP